MSTNPPQRIPAPPLEPNLGWLNTDRPVDLLELRGKVVLLDFWTYCCINCHHVLPDLAWLERKYPNELVVIGVHTAKFTNERELDHVRQAVLRHEIEHPVVLDQDFAIWRRYGVRGWPTLWVIDPEGFLVGQVSGEGHRVLLDQAVAELIAHNEPLLTLDREPVRFALEREHEAATPLRFPGKVLAAPGGRIFIADTNHNRVVIARADGSVDAV
ncbi:MAG: redoxin domain-containing protein, partial [Myxococcales bacterium]|nr:redoxin domain-containing protein [Myxococcales bacterium]